MCEKVAPWLRIPESQIPLGEPGVPEVLVWPLEDQVHCTVSPCWMVRDEGEKKNPPSPTVTVTVVAIATVGLNARSGKSNAANALRILLVTSRRFCQRRELAVEQKKGRRALGTPSN